jgi:hypothetical protein
LKEQAKSREVSLDQINDYKEETLKEMEKLKTKFIGKSSLKVSKNVIWDNISKFIFGNCYHFSIIRDEMELLTSSKKDITRTTNELENKLDLANDIIKFLNKRNKEELKELNVNDITNTIIDAKKSLTKRRLMKNVENRLHPMTREVAACKSIFTKLLKIGFPPT